MTGVSPPAASRPTQQNCRGRAARLCLAWLFGASVSFCGLCGRGCGRGGHSTAPNCHAKWYGISTERMSHSPVPAAASTRSWGFSECPRGDDDLGGPCHGSDHSAAVTCVATVTVVDSWNRRCGGILGHAGAFPGVLGGGDADMRKGRNSAARIRANAASSATQGSRQQDRAPFGTIHQAFSFRPLREAEWGDLSIRATSLTTPRPAVLSMQLVQQRLLFRHPYGEGGFNIG
jgi:hypothetical protein